VLATPYLFVYDLVLLAVPVAFLVRFALSRGFLASELVLLPVVCALLLSYLVVPVQVGLAAALIVAALIGRRAMRAETLP
jgi:hypothetical protein